MFALGGDGVPSGAGRAEPSGGGVELTH